MKKYILVVVCFLLLFSCSQNSEQNDFVGSWTGNVLIVDVTYIFTKKTFETKTLSFNNVMVGGKKGKISKIENGVLHLEETHTYFFDSDKNQGMWQASQDTYTITYSIVDTKMSIEPSYAKNALIKRIELEKDSKNANNK